MSRPRRDATELIVDIDGIQIPAILRKPGQGRRHYHVRWKLHGVWRSATTGRDLQREAEVVARQIVRGEKPEMPPSLSEGMTVKEFERIQQDHFKLGGRDRAASKTQQSFDGIWRSLRSVVAFRTIQEVTATNALHYVRTLQQTSKARNHKHRKKVAEPMSSDTIRKHVRTLKAAWNRVKRDHPEAVSGIPNERMVTVNPWEQIRNQVPKAKPKGDPVQFDLDNGELDKFLDQFVSRPVAELFLITSLWFGGRIEEMSHLSWSWCDRGYFTIPDPIAKKGLGKVVRLPAALMNRLAGIRVPGEDYVFARFPQEVHQVSGRRTLPFSPERLMWRIGKLVKEAATAIGRPEGLTHHALRRTAMELSDEGELMEKEKESARKLQTTVGNKRKNYLKRGGKKRRILADGLFENMTVSLQEYPSLAARLGSDIIAAGAGTDLKSLASQLTPLEKEQLRKLLDGDSEGTGAGVA
jgi:hypothetical protein